MSQDFIPTDVISKYNTLLNGNIQKFEKNFDNMQPIENFENILNSQIKCFDDIEQFDYKNIEVAKQSVPEANDAASLMNNFKEAFSDGLNSLNDKQAASQRANEIFAAGGDIDIHEVMIAAEKANVSMQLALQMRNRMISFYNEIKNMNF